MSKYVLRLYRRSISSHGDSDESQIAVGFGDTVDLTLQDMRIRQGEKADRQDALLRELSELLAKPEED